MKPILGFLLIICLVGCGKDGPTGPQGQTLEVDTEKYDNGNIKVEFQYYRDGGSVIKHGYYKMFDWDGNIVAEGQYKEGERWSGEFENVVKWDSDEEKWVETEKEADDDFGIFRGRFTYSAGKWNGKAVSYYEDGQIRSEANYKDGEWDGKQVFYYPNGQIEREGNYVDGKREGKEFWYYENGQIRWEINYKDGEFHGKWVLYLKGGSAFESCYDMGRSVDCP